MSLAVIISIGGAFASRLHNLTCAGDRQYYYAGGVYTYAGVLGQNYLCDLGDITCTYYTVDNLHYYPCVIGVHCTANCLTGEITNPVKPKEQVPGPEHPGK
jgi:hypothetical protein